MATMKVSLPDLMKKWVEDEIKSGLLQIRYTVPVIPEFRRFCAILLA